MSAFAQKVASLRGLSEDRLERLAGGDLSEVLLVKGRDGTLAVAKGGTGIATEAAMLRALAGAGVPAPLVEGEYDGILLLGYVPNDQLFSPHAWSDIAAAIARLHARTGDSYGWDTDYQLGTVAMDNRPAGDWPRFWGEQRLASTAAVLDRGWRDRIDRLCIRLPDLLPVAPSPAHLHGDLWTGNILVSDGRLAALIDPACYFGDREVDLAMLDLFDAPPPEFWSSYGPLEPGWGERRLIYQLFPALVHLRLFGGSYAGMVDRLLQAFDA